MTPSDPDTMMPTLAEAHLTCIAGHEFVVFTCDLQLYYVALHIMWIYLDRFPNVIMHSHMSFVSSIGTLMAESGRRLATSS